MENIEKMSPFSIRVIGFGQQSEHTIKATKALGYDGLSAELYSDGNALIPTENDKMVILIVTTNSERVRSVAKTFYEADVLTLAILTHSEEMPSDYLDSYTVVRSEEVGNTIKSLIEPIFMPSQISYDIHDLRLTLANAKHFIVATSEGKGENRVKDAIKEVYSSICTPQREDIERLSILLYYNHNGSHPLTVNELSNISEFINTLPENVEAVWGLNKDKTLDTDSIRISIIASGKDLKL